MWCSGSGSQPQRGPPLLMASARSAQVVCRCRGYGHVVQSPVVTRPRGITLRGGERALARATTWRHRRGGWHRSTNATGACCGASVCHLPGPAQQVVRHTRCSSSIEQHSRRLEAGSVSRGDRTGSYRPGPLTWLAASYSPTTPSSYYSAASLAVATTCAHCRAERHNRGYQRDHRGDQLQPLLRVRHLTCLLPFT